MCVNWFDARYRIRKSFVTSQWHQLLKAFGRTCRTKIADHVSSPEKTDLLVAMEPWQEDLIIPNLACGHHTTLMGMWSKPVRPYISSLFNR